MASLTQSQLFWSLCLSIVCLSICCVEPAFGNEADSLINDVYGTKLKKARATSTGDDDIKLAGEMVGQAERTADLTPTLRVALYAHAFDLASPHPGGMATALKALVKLNKLAPDRRAEWNAKELEMLRLQYLRAKGVARSIAAEHYLDQLIRNARNFAAKRQIAELDDARRRAAPVVRDVPQNQRAGYTEKIKAINDWRRVLQRRKTLEERLAKKPDDGIAADELVKLLIVEFEDSTKAKEIVPACKDAALKANATLAAMDAAELSADQSFDLANWYIQLGRAAQGHSSTWMRRKALAYFERALAKQSLEAKKKFKATVTRDELAKALKNEPFVQSPWNATTDSSPPNRAAVPVGNLRPGLIVHQYARISTQKGNSGFIHPDKLGQPIGQPKTIGNVRNWHYDAGKNAVASGYLLLPVAGRYKFNSNNFYDRNALFINDKRVCGYRDGEGKQVAVMLPKGLVRISSVGYVDGRGSVQVRWRPPGQEGMGPIPSEMLFHKTP